MKKFLLPLMGLAFLPAMAANEITLSFNVDGETDPTAVEVYVEGMDGVTASVKSCNADLKELADPTIFCPNINGNAGMDVVLQIELNGLPAGTAFDKVGMYVWAYNGSGGLQQYPSDGKNRFFNVDVALDNKSLVYFEDIDVAAGVEEENAGSEWLEEAGEPVVAGSPAVLELNILSGSENVGCFFGLETITLYTADGAGSGDDNNGEDDGNGTEPAPVLSILGIYDVTYLFTANNSSDYRTENDVEIYEIDGNTVGITSNIFSFINCTDLVGTFDPDNKTLTIDAYENENAFPGYELYFYSMDIDDFFDEIVFEVGEDGSMVATSDAGTEFDLWYTAGDYWGYFMEDFEWILVERTSAVKDLQKEEVNADAPVVFYDLQGRKVANPSNGIFIRQQGSKTSKVVIK